MGKKGFVVEPLLGRSGTKTWCSSGPHFYCYYKFSTLTNTPTTRSPSHSGSKDLCVCVHMWSSNDSDSIQTVASEKPNSSPWSQRREGRKHIDCKKIKITYCSKKIKLERCLIYIEWISLPRPSALKSNSWIANLSVLIAQFNGLLLHPFSIVTITSVCSVFYNNIRLYNFNSNVSFIEQSVRLPLIYPLTEQQCKRGE